MVNFELLDRVLLDLGHDDFNMGTKYLREAVRIWAEENGPALTKRVYPAIAKMHNSTAARVERCMRHSIEKAWSGRGCAETRNYVFGYSYSAVMGRPTVGEYIARLAAHCEDTL